MALAGVLCIRRSDTGNPSLRFSVDPGIPGYCERKELWHLASCLWVLAYWCIWKQRFPFFVSVFGLAEGKHTVGWISLVLGHECLELALEYIML